MTWTQDVNPLNNTALSAVVASIPIIFIFWAFVEFICQVLIKFPQYYVMIIVM